MSVNVLFVCLGNICRSPTAHGIFQQRVETAGLSTLINVDSAGTGDWHIGKGPDARAAAAAARRGYDLSALRARQVSAEDFAQFDYVLAMDRDNLRNLSLIKPEDYSGRLDLFLHFGPYAEVDEVPDPYFGGEEGFEYVLDLVEAASDGLLKDIVARHRL